MPERDPFDFSALAEDPEGEAMLEDMPVYEAGGRAAMAAQFLAADEGFSVDMDDFEAELQRLMSEEQALSFTDDDVERDMRQLRQAIAFLNESLVDFDLDAEEALLESLLAEDDELP